MKALFDVSRVPFSASGSWMSLSIPKGETELCFRNHHFKANNLFSIQAVRDGKAVELFVDASPALLSMTCIDGHIEICFDGPDSVRLRGQGVGVQFVTRHCHAYANGDNMAVFNFRKPLRRYQFEGLSGTLSLHGAYASEKEDLQNLAMTEGAKVLEASKERDVQVIEVLPGDDGQWDVAIDEFWSTWVPREREPFETCLEVSQASFSSFCDSMPAGPESLAEPRELASYVDWSCTMNPCGLVKRPSLFMSKNWMNNVWSWDQCFNAMALASGQPQLSLDQMLTLVDHQDEFGAYTDAFNDIEKHYNFSKPPVHGFTLMELLKRLPEPPSEHVLTTLYESLGRQADWWMTHRVLDANDSSSCRSLPYYLHGNDSGWDNSTMFSAGVPLVAPDLSSLLVVQMSALGDVAEQLGRREESASWQQRADSLFEALMRELWQGNRFVAKLANTGETVDSMSLIPCLPLMLGERLSQEKREALKSRMEKHLTEWGLATERVDSPNYIPDGYWRGPIWAPSSYLAVVGLERSGYHEFAREIAQRFCRLCAMSGFAENYNAVTGEPLRDPAYTWTASVFLLMLERVPAFGEETL